MKFAMKRDNISFSIELGKLNTCAFYFTIMILKHNSLQDTIEWSVFVFKQNLSNHCIATK